MQSLRDRWIAFHYPQRIHTLDSAEGLPTSIETKPQDDSASLVKNLPAKPAEVQEDDQLRGPLVELEAPRPLSAFDDDPVLGTADAARILGIAADTMKKWRQRNQGPEYIQYEANGPVLYRLSALRQYQATHTVKPTGNHDATSLRRSRRNKRPRWGLKSSL